jgi:hypothetical protein
MNSKRLLNLPAISIILAAATLAGLSGCRGTAQLIPESVIVRDTVIVTKERTLTDTLTILKDTVLYQDRVKVELKYRDKLVYVKAECPPDTVRVETIKVVTSKPEKQQSKFDKFVDNLSVLLLITLLLCIVYWIVRLLK